MNALSNLIVVLSAMSFFAASAESMVTSIMLKRQVNFDL